MKGAFIIIIMITLLIAGILVIKNYNTGVAEGTATKREAIDISKEAAEKANEAAQKIKDINKQLTGSD
jgi:cell division protein FtsX